MLGLQYLLVKVSKAELPLGVALSSTEAWFRATRNARKLLVSIGANHTASKEASEVANGHLKSEASCLNY